MATEAATRMARVVAAAAPHLKAAGFRKRRHAFNRSTEPGVTQVLNFTMAAVHQSIYGSFTVDLGVFSRNLHVDEREIGKWINDYDCQLRKRIGDLLPESEDDCWALDAPNVQEPAIEAILDHGLPWLDQFPSDPAILERYREQGREELGMTPRAPLEIASLLVAAGDLKAATDTARAYLAEPLQPNHRPYAREVIERLGLGAALAGE